ncbi:GAF domain-containing protein [Streptomyces sp. A7024]|uniref:GAF domain-containing protein n=2 Tax=Streptomyces coryli TaxID=1128680 RepID=A0A6G4U9S9_9ACTN|nr:GAF domain-containing protein [Streptomyces coryli]
MTTDAYPAWHPGRDPGVLRREVARAHEEFLAGGRPPGAPGSPLREVVRDSWLRSRSGGVDPERSAPAVALPDPELRAYRREHPLAHVLPVIRRLLVETAADADQLVAVGDERARLLWVEGAPRLAARAEGIGFVPGADWGEGSAGTNAPGTALALGRPLQIYGSEHFSRPVHPWSCSAAPVRDPDTGAVLGVVDLTGGDQVAGPHALALVRATAAAAEAELRVLRLQGRLPAPPRPAATARLAVLGRERALLDTPSGSFELSPRHSEIVLLLARHPRGLTADALGARLHEEEAARVTVRAEMSRLRALLGPGLLTSRPYRLTGPVAVDADEVRALLAAGACRDALAAYPGPLLPRSQSPEVTDAREELECQLREVLRAHADATPLLEWLARPENADDAEMLQAAADALPPGSPRELMLRTRLERMLW